MGNGWTYSPRSGQDGHENESERYGVSDQESLNLGYNRFKKSEIIETYNFSGRYKK
jgi:hypothetical protein